VKGSELNNVILGCTNRRCRVFLGDEILYGGT
jgi:hypothetical protein